MTSTDNPPGAKLSTGFTRTWGFKAGLLLIIGGHLVLLAVLAAIGLGADWWGRFRRIFVLEAPRIQRT